MLTDALKADDHNKDFCPWLHGSGNNSSNGATAYGFDFGADVPRLNPLKHPIDLKIPTTWPALCFFADQVWRNGHDSTEIYRQAILLAHPSTGVSRPVLAPDVWRAGVYGTGANQ